MRMIGLLATIALSFAVAFGLLAITAKTWIGLWAFAVVMCMSIAVGYASVQRLRQERWRELIVED
ncbi:hypothetical protein [Litoreibacter arenae]|uniref:Uncharacterized protein n=1 Tax=Litoreibacter arenae DSM 19593 TaxID=1123360 RepID=S9QE61_9RHOB|nr:hypothetical protein [Litoreibacter arenae]EPX77878.1 hypothetical protein thalar_03605 [Litoreibacter arenae DSM 19593]